MRASIFKRLLLITFLCVIYVFLNTGFVLAGGTNWTGEGGTTNWNTASNWDSGVPDDGDDVKIKSNDDAIYPVITSGVTAYTKKLTIQNGATLTISGGIIYHKKEFLVESGGTFIQSGGTVHGKNGPANPDQNFKNEGLASQSAGSIECKDFINESSFDQTGGEIVGNSFKNDKTTSVFNQSGTTSKLDLGKEFKNNGIATQTGGEIHCKDFKMENDAAIFTQNGLNALLTIGKNFKKKKGTFNSTSGLVKWTGSEEGSKDAIFNIGINQFNNIQFDGDKKPNFQKTGGSILVSGDFTNNNATVDLSGNKTTTVTFNGSTDQLIKGTESTTFNNLTILTSSGAQVSLVGDQFVDDEGTLLITSGTLEVLSESNLTVENILTNNAGASGLVISSSASGTGSLLHNTDGVNASVRQYLTEDEWHYVSSPISNGLSGIFTDIYLKSFNEPTQTWNDYITSTTESLEVMRGYAAWTYDIATVSFEGSMNNGSQSGVVTAQNTGPNGGYNLVGNPYPSALDWDASGWDKSDVDNTIYFWEGVGGIYGTGNYHYYIGSGGEVPSVGINDATSIIPSMQGFFVRATSDGTLGVNNDARLHRDQAYYKNSSKNILPLIRLRSKNASELSDETVIRFYSGATVEHDGDYDAFKLEGYAVPQLYSITPEETKLAINTLQKYENGTIIPLGFTSPEQGEYSITLTEFENDKSGMTLFLEDLLQDRMHEMSINSTYNFKSGPGDDPNRFLLHFTKLNYKSIPKNENSPKSIYAYGNTVYVQVEDLGETEVSVFNLMGQKVVQMQSSEQGLMKFVVDQKPGYYVVRVKNGSNISSEKVFISN